MGNETVVWLEEVGKEDIAIVGGKGASLGEMIRVELPVPGGFSVTAQAFRRFVDENGVSDKLFRSLEAEVDDANIQRGIEKLEIKMAQSMLILESHSNDQLLISKIKSCDNSDVNASENSTFKETRVVAKDTKLYGAEQDLLSDTFSGYISGMGSECTEMEFIERNSELLVTFLMDKIEPKTFNLWIHKIFTLPVNTPGSVIDSSSHNRFRFESWKTEQKRIFMNAPQELYIMLAPIRAKSRCVIKCVFQKRKPVNYTKKKVIKLLLCGQMPWQPAMKVSKRWCYDYN